MSTASDAEGSHHLLRASDAVRTGCAAYEEQFGELRTSPAAGYSLRQQPDAPGSQQSSRARASWRSLGVPLKRALSPAERTHFHETRLLFIPGVVTLFRKFIAILRGSPVECHAHARSRRSRRKRRDSCVRVACAFGSSRRGRRRRRRRRRLLRASRSATPARELVWEIFRTLLRCPRLLLPPPRSTLGRNRVSA